MARFCDSSPPAARREYCLLPLVAPAAIALRSLRNCFVVQRLGILGPPHAACSWAAHVTRWLQQNWVRRLVSQGHLCMVAHAKGRSGEPRRLGRPAGVAASRSGPPETDRRQLRRVCGTRDSARAVARSCWRTAVAGQPSRSRSQSERVMARASRAAHLRPASTVLRSRAGMRSRHAAPVIVARGPAGAPICTQFGFLVIVVSRRVEAILGCMPPGCDVANLVS